MSDDDEFDDVDVVKEALDSDPDRYVFMVADGGEFNAVVTANPKQTVEMLGVMMLAIHQQTDVPVGRIAMDAVGAAHRNEGAPGFHQVR